MSSRLPIPGVGRVLGNFPIETRLIHAFVAAHAVHYLSVATLLLAFERQLVGQHPGQAAGFISVGLLMLVVLALTASARQGIASMVRLTTLCGASVIFFLAFFRHSFLPLRGIALLIVIALAMRLMSRQTYRTARAGTG
jgi:hypothetical protein